MRVVQRILPGAGCVILLNQPNAADVGAQDGPARVQLRRHILSIPDVCGFHTGNRFAVPQAVRTVIIRRGSGSIDHLHQTVEAVICILLAGSAGGFGLRIAICVVGVVGYLLRTAAGSGLGEQTVVAVIRVIGRVALRTCDRHGQAVSGFIKAVCLGDRVRCSTFSFLRQAALRIIGIACRPAGMVVFLRLITV